MNKLDMLTPLIFMLTIIMMMMIMWNEFHPTHLILMLIVYSIFISLNLSLLKKTFMYSIMLFLIMISGVLIIFLYFSSLISNEKTSSPSMNKLLYLLSILTSSMILMTKYNDLSPIENNSEMKSNMQIQTSMFNNIESIYTYPFNSMSILCMMFLLISMLAIIKIISFKTSPLRKIN
nr:TPA_asm: NADH dehydrogenase subunit 6 [Pseudomyrmex pallidus]